jgi:hypothetical protein
MQEDLRGCTWNTFRKYQRLTAEWEVWYHSLRLPACVGGFGCERNRPELTRMSYVR